MIFIRYRFIVYFLENMENIENIENIENTENKENIENIETKRRVNWINEASLLDRIKMTETLESTATNQEKMSQ